MTNPMNEGDFETMNIVQQVLKGLMLSLAAASKADLSMLANSLEAFSTARTLDPLAHRMLEDLAAGAHAIGVTGQRKQ